MVIYFCHISNRCNIVYVVINFKIRSDNQMGSKRSSHLTMFDTFRNISICSSRLFFPPSLHSFILQIVKLTFYSFCCLYGRNLMPIYNSSCSIFPHYCLRFSTISYWNQLSQHRNPKVTCLVFDFAITKNRKSVIWWIKNKRLLNGTCQTLLENRDALSHKLEVIVDYYIHKNWMRINESEIGMFVFPPLLDDKIKSGTFNSFSNVTFLVPMTISSIHFYLQSILFFSILGKLDYHKKKNFQQDVDKK